MTVDEVAADELAPLLVAEPDAIVNPKVPLVVFGIAETVTVYDPTDPATAIVPSGQPGTP
jgi:hypothetical protein